MVIASVGITVYLINKWKTPSTMLDSAVEEPPEIDEEEPADADPDTAQSKEPNEGNVADTAQEKSQGGEEVSQGDKGKGEVTQSKAEEGDTMKTQGSQSGSAAGSAGRADTVPISGSGGDGEHVNERAVEHEIKKLIHKVVMERDEWLTRPDSLRNTFELHELLEIGNKLLNQLEKIDKSISSPKPK